MADLERFLRKTPLGPLGVKVDPSFVKVQYLVSSRISLSS
jgi:hypothetical protein